MGKLQMQIFDAPGTFNVPLTPPVSCVWIAHMIGGGGAGASVASLNGGGGGGGSGEHAMMRAVAVTPGGTLAVNPGAGGNGSTNPSTDGGSSTVGPYFVALGGTHGAAVNSGNGAGLSGGTTVTNGGNGRPFVSQTTPGLNVASVVLAAQGDAGGSSGGGGGVVSGTIPGGPGGSSLGQLIGGLGGNAIVNQVGGGGGGATMWGPGANGANGTSAPATPGAATNPGSGGGGATNLLVGGPFQPGGNAAPGRIVVQWFG